VFIACFSQRSITRSRSYQNEELALAIEELRSRRPGDPWLIPVRFSDCDIPEIDIGMGRTLRSIQRADLFGDREEENATRLVKSVLRILRFTADISPMPIRDNTRAQDPSPSQTQEPISLVRPITQGRTEATPPVSPSAPAPRKPRRTVITSAAIAVLLAGVGVGIWLSQDHSPPQHHSSPLTVNTCARTSSAPSVPVELGIMSVGRPGLNKDFIGATFGPDCQVLATGGNGTVQVWNMVTGHRIAALPVFPGGWAFGAAFSPDGKTIAVPAGDGTVTLWDVATGHLKGTLNSDPNGSTFSALLSPDGATLFTGGSTKVVDEWDMATRKLMRTIPTPGIGSLALSPGGKVLAVGGADGTQRLWDVASGRRVATLPGHKGNSFALAFSPEGGTLAVGTYSGGVQWWDVASGKLITQGTGSVTDVAFSPRDPAKS
jgi:WD40 repeat protein